MTSITCPVIAGENDESIELSTYDRTVGTYVVISCKGFGRQVRDPTNVECLPTGAWSATPKLECYTALDEKESIIVGVAAGCAGLVILVLICIWCYCCFYRRRRGSDYRKTGNPRWFDRWNLWNQDEPDYFRSSRRLDDDYPRNSALRESSYPKSRRDDDFRDTMRNDDYRRPMKNSYDGSFRKSRRYSDDDLPFRRTTGDLGRSRIYDDDDFRRTRRNSFNESSFRRTRGNSLDDPPLRRTRRYSDGGKTDRDDLYERGPIRIIEDGIIEVRSPGVKEHSTEIIPAQSTYGQSIVRREITAPSVVRQVAQPTVIRHVRQPSVIREVAQPTIIREVVEPSYIREVAQPTYIREVAQPTVVKYEDQPIFRSVQEHSPLRYTTRYIRPVQNGGSTYSYGTNGMYGSSRKIVPAANIRELDGDPLYSTTRTGHYELTTTKRDPFDTRSNTGYFYGRQDFPYEDSNKKKFSHVLYHGNGKETEIFENDW